MHLAADLVYDKPWVENFNVCETPLKDFLH